MGADDIPSDIPKHSKTRKKKNRKVVYFDKEIVTKESAEKFLLNEPISDGNKTNHNSLEIVKFKTVTDEKANDMPDLVNNLLKSKSDIKRKKSKQNKISETNEVTVPTINSDNSADSKIKLGKKRKVVHDAHKMKISENDEINVVKKPERKKIPETNKVTVSTENSDNGANSSIKLGKKGKKTKVNDNQKEVSENTEISLEKPNIKQEESIRARKRKKHAKLLEEKQLKAEIAAQQSALNYLSLWKYNRIDWKFEKLKQIWLQQNLFDSGKMPEEFWDTVVEYFCGSKGSVRNVILKKAVGVIEKEDKSEEENKDENYLLCLQRARDIVQNLQE